MRLNMLRAGLAGALGLVLWSCTDAGLLEPPTQSARAIISTGSLVISEVMPDPTKVADASGEWFELYNGTPAAINLQGYRIVSAAGATSTESHTIASAVVVGSGEYVVLGNNANTATNGGVAEAYSYGGSIALNNGSSTSATEWLAIRTPGGVTLDSVAYAVRATPTSAPGGYTPPAGASRGVIDLTADNTVISGSNWLTSTTTYGLGDKGTPGVPNTGGAVATVTVRPSWVTPGTTFKVTASAVDSVGKSANTIFTWSSSDPSIATVDPTTGVVTGVSLGTITLTATAANGVQGSGPVFVISPGDVASISISINDPAQVPVGYTKPAFPTSKTTTGATVTPTLTWSSTNPAVATVSDLGYVTGTGVGQTEIRATAPDGVYGSFAFTVIPADAPTSAIYRNHVEFGAPAGGPSGILLSKRQYVTSYNPERGGPNWVSWNLNASQFSGVPRCDCFSADQTLPADVYHVVDFDYRNGGYDRGHMVQSESRTTTDQENASTFLLTNILPQAAENNQGPWSQFENYLNDLARTGGKEIYVVAGGEFAATPGTLKGEGKVAIPDYTWKVAVIMDGGKGLADVHSTADLQVIAIKMPNLTTSGGPASAVGIRNVPWQTYTVTVNQIEAETGYDLLSALPNTIETLVEANDRAPVAATDGPYTGLEGSPVTLSGAASSDPDGDALTYAWDFGDGTTGTGATPQHTYGDNGNYLVTLTVTDPAGAEATATTAVTVFNVTPSVASLADASILAHGSYSASGSFGDPGDDQWTATVNYGDGSGVQPLDLTGKGFSLDHTYTAAGSYTVTVTVTDDEGATGTRSATVTVTNVAPAVEAFAGASILAHGSYSAAGTFADPGNDTWTATVNYGDGSGTQALDLSGKSFSLEHTYAAAGSYTVTVTVTDDQGATGTNAATVTVTNVAPSVSAFSGASLLLHQGYAATGSFDDPGNDSWTATVDYGDGSGAHALALSGKSFSLSHTYAAPGTYTVTVTVTDDGDLSGTSTAEVTVTNVAPMVNAFAGATLLPHETYTASGSFTDPGPDSWTATVDYGDGSGAHALALSGKSFALSHTYAAAGTYTVTVTVTDDGGLSRSRTATVTVLSQSQAIQNLQAQAAPFAGRPGIGQSLNSLLQNALKEVQRGRADQGVEHLQNFVAHVQNDVRGRNLSQAEGDALIAAARRIIASLS